MRGDSGARREDVKFNSESTRKSKTSGGGARYSTMRFPFLKMLIYCWCVVKLKAVKNGFPAVEQMTVLVYSVLLLQNRVSFHDQEKRRRELEGAQGVGIWS